jgi:hypothetical protein
MLQLRIVNFTLVRPNIERTKIFFTYPILAKDRFLFIWGCVHPTVVLQIKPRRLLDFLQLSWNGQMAPTSRPVLGSTGSRRSAPATTSSEGLAMSLHGATTHTSGEDSFDTCG